MAKETKKTKLKFFGIGRIVPYLAKLKKLIVLMVFFGLMGSFLPWKDPPGTIRPPCAAANRSRSWLWRPSSGAPDGIFLHTR